jgi:hypothetical protein
VLLHLVSSALVVARGQTIQAQQRVLREADLAKADVLAEGIVLPCRSSKTSRVSDSLVMLHCRMYWPATGVQEVSTHALQAAPHPDAGLGL